MKRFKSISPEEYTCKPIHLMGRQWFLLTAGNEDKFNTMTCAWGGIGFLWNRPVVYTFVRPQRFTFEFTEKFSQFTMCFFEDQHRDVLNYCGTHSGRDVDKMKETGLISCVDEDGFIYYDQAQTILKCRKLFATELSETDIIAPEILDVYPQKDFHIMYIGQIEDILVQEQTDDEIYD